MRLFPRRRQWWRKLAKLLPLAVIFIVMLPLLALAWTWTTWAGDIWQHLLATDMGLMVRNTLTLAAGVMILTAVLGVSLGALTSLSDFPGRRFLTRALLLPLAIPPYVTALVYSGLLEFSGPIPRLLRDYLGAERGTLPIRSLGGAILMLSLSLYPYVFYIARVAFLRQSRQVLEAGRSLGCSSQGLFWRLALPMALPWIGGALALVAMETMADFGLVATLSVQTFTTAIYKVWYGLFSIEAAGQLASLLLLFVAGIFFFEKHQQRRTTVAYNGLAASSLPPFRLGRMATIGTWLLASLVLTLGALIPLGQLLVWAWQRRRESSLWDLMSPLLHSLAVGAMVASAVTALSLFLHLAQRFRFGVINDWALRLSSLGYAIPGSVLAVGIYVPLIHADRALAGALDRLWGGDTELILTGTVFTLVCGLVLRFSAVAHAGIGPSLAGLSTRLDEAGHSLGARGADLCWRIHLPLLRRALVIAWILVFVDVVKEMPLTLMTRPFGWDTLAVRIFSLTTEGEWQRAALPALLLCLLGMGPVIIMALRRDFELSEDGK